jgi:hypothetical protein
VPIHRPRVVKSKPTTHNTALRQNAAPRIKPTRGSMAQDECIVRVLVVVTNEDDEMQFGQPVEIELPHDWTWTRIPINVIVCEDNGVAYLIVLSELQTCLVINLNTGRSKVMSVPLDRESIIFAGPGLSFFTGGPSKTEVQHWVPTDDGSAFALATPFEGIFSPGIVVYNPESSCLCVVTVDRDHPVCDTPALHLLDASGKNRWHLVLSTVDVVNAGSARTTIIGTITGAFATWDGTGDFVIMGVAMDPFLRDQHWITRVSVNTDTGAVTLTRVDNLFGHVSTRALVADGRNGFYGVEWSRVTCYSDDGDVTFDSFGQESYILNITRSKNYLALVSTKTVHVLRLLALRLCWIWACVAQ